MKVCDKKSLKYVESWEENESSLKDDRVDKFFLIVVKHNYAVDVEKKPKVFSNFQNSTRCENK